MGAPTPASAGLLETGSLTIGSTVEPGVVPGALPPGVNTCSTYNGVTVCNVHAGHQVQIGSCSACVSSVNGVIHLRGVRDRLTLGGTAWSVPSGRFGTEWIGIEIDSEIVQAGYLYSDVALTGCSSDTGGVVKMFVYAIASDGSTYCHLYGSGVSLGDVHDFKIERCDTSTNSTTWCFYIDGNYETKFDPGFGSGDASPALGEWYCQSASTTCPTSSSELDADYGGSANPWAVTGCTADGCTPGEVDWQTVASSDQYVYDDSCFAVNGQGPDYNTYNWSIGNFSSSSAYHVDWPGTTYNPPGFTC